MGPALRTLIFTFLVPGTVTIGVPWLLLRSAEGARLPSIGALPALGAIVLLAGVGIYAWCATDFVRARGTPAPIDPPKELVVRGLYRVTRNPMYVGVLSIVTGEAIFFASLPLLVFAALLFAMFHGFVVWYEEPTLRRSFGAAYERYCETVPRWLR